MYNNKQYETKETSNNHSINNKNRVGNRFILKRKRMLEIYYRVGFLVGWGGQLKKMSCLEKKKKNHQAKTKKFDGHTTIKKERKRYQQTKHHHQEKKKSNNFCLPLLLLLFLC